MNLYEQAFKEAFATRIAEAPPVPPLPPIMGDAAPRYRGVKWALVGVAASMSLIGGFAWGLMDSNPNNPPQIGSTASGSPSQGPSNQTTPSPSASPSTSATSGPTTSRSPSGGTTTSTKPNTPTSQVMCQVQLPTQWATKLQAGAVPNDPRQLASTEKDLGGYPLAYATDRYAYVALFNPAEHPQGYDGMVSEVVNGARKDLVPIDGDFGWPAQAAYVGNDLIILHNFGSQNTEVVRYRGVSRTPDAAEMSNSVVGEFAVVGGKLAWLAYEDVDTDRLRIYVYDPQSGTTIEGPRVTGDQLVGWNGQLVVANLGQNSQPTFRAYDLNLNSVALPAALDQLRGPVSGVAADGETLAWTVEGDKTIQFFRKEMTAPAQLAGASEVLIVSSVSGSLLTAYSGLSFSVVDLTTGGWTPIGTRASAVDGRLTVGGPPAWGGAVGNWSTPINSLNPLPGCQR